MRGAGRKVAVMQIIGFDPAFDEAAHQRFQCGGIIIDAAQQYRLADHRDTGIDNVSAGRAGLAGQFPDMIGVQRDPCRRTSDLER